MKTCISRFVSFDSIQAVDVVDCIRRFHPVVAVGHDGVIVVTLPDAVDYNSVGQVALLDARDVDHVAV